ncbi:MAG: FAD-dependent oxidoreductase [Desulfobulbaceae bacterium]|jgi:NADPH-dependent 2,4-dienoyl-CoA reductase/sulfur reductase-like enzyme/rhodanese-related sulfurtransferase|nr:FAD-dependent oxidoreductase [Desulfobulbaceae bacterium]MDH3922011.1 FAD-dependent oxidoreductase [Desulfobulbaceae bacterium]MDH3995445.1 FAD-dependent oxidoreductase [Desulfobulbaceae bacterium]PLX46298.1 MAG: pyridine nucleotide-disulfide oxidoreductase [Desulfobulbaceae bacterium]
MSEKIVVIGGVAAGPKAACRVKRLLPDAEVVVIDQDSLVSYGGCGIPYFVSGDVSDEKELRSTSFHVVRDEDFFSQAKGVTMLTRTRALAIDRQAKTVRVEQLDTGETNELPYDKLVLATGSVPNRLQIPGADLEGVYVVNDMHRAIAIKNDLARGKVSKAVVIGGGAIGLEMAESLADLWGIETTVLEYMDQLLPRIVDPPFAAMLEKHLRDNNVTVYTGESATGLESDAAGRVCRVTTPKRSIDADLVIMSVGVRPRTDLAREAGLLVSPQGGIVVNNRMQTSDPVVYAAGDCVEISNQVSGMKNNAPMGSLANRQGRVVADNIAGIPSQFEGWVGSFIMKAFECCIGGTGLSCMSAKGLGYDAAVAITAQSDRAHFFPTQAVILLQMVFDKTSRKVLGLQGFGPMNDSVLARINGAAGLIAKGAYIEDFSNLELAYAPPFSTAVDALNATANVADNLAAGRLRTLSIEDFLEWMAKPQAKPAWVALDIRHPKEAAEFVQKFGADLWKDIPYVNVRARYKELPHDKTLIIICDAGTRSSEVQVFLDSVGWGNNLVLGGGFNAIRRIGVDWWPA